MTERLCLVCEVVIRPGTVGMFLGEGITVRDCKSKGWLCVEHAGALQSALAALHAANLRQQMVDAHARRSD